MIPTRAEYAAFRSLILGDLVRLRRAFLAGALSYDDYARAHHDLSLFLSEVNQMELDDYKCVPPRLELEACFHAHELNAAQILSFQFSTP